MTHKRPSISIVTPSFNQGQFLEETICSVLGQNFSNLEYVVMDGGSTDNSVDIIRKYSERLTYWTSEKDKGNYDAINRGFSHTSGEIMAWINSDDKYLPWTFSVVAEIFECFPEIEWLTSAYPQHWDRDGRVIACYYSAGASRASFLRGANLPLRKWHVGHWVQQESTFWRRTLWDRCGGALDGSTIAGDFELWARFFSQAELYAVGVPLGGFRMHGNQISANRRREYLASGEAILSRYGGRCFSAPRRLARLMLYLAFGGRPLHRLPRSLGTALCACGVLFPAPLCLWERGSWKVVRNYLF